MHLRGGLAIRIECPIILTSTVYRQNDWIVWAIQVSWVHVPRPVVVQRMFAWLDIIHTRIADTCLSAISLQCRPQASITITKSTFHTFFETSNCTVKGMFKNSCITYMHILVRLLLYWPVFNKRNEFASDAGIWHPHAFRSILVYRAWLADSKIHPNVNESLFFFLF